MAITMQFLFPFSAKPFVAFGNFKAAFHTERISDILIKKEIGSKFRVKGWIKGIRNLKKNVFVDVSDGSTFKKLQVFIPKLNFPKNASYGCAVEVEGELKRQPNGEVELSSHAFQVIGICDLNDEYPFKKRQPPEYEREYPHFRSRNETFASTLRLRDGMARCIRDYFFQEHFINVHTPILTSNDCEGAGEIFKVLPDNETLANEMKKEECSLDEAFFDTKTFLTVSAQLHLETAARSLVNVYQLGPIFRAENSKSRLHLTEFYMMEAEMAFMKDLGPLLKRMEHFVHHVTKVVANNLADELNFHRKRLAVQNDILQKITENSFHILTYKEAAELLQRNNDNFSKPFIPDKQFSKEHELFIVKSNNQVPVFVINWPQHLKPFYAKSISEDSTTVAAVDLLFPEVGELCGGSVREDDYGVLEERLSRLHLSEKLSWYLSLRKFGNVSTAGFGLGFERYLKVLLGTQNIKDTIPFPRWPHNCRL